MDEALTVDAWAVADTGLVSVPGPFRRLPGAVRHHQGRGEQWPKDVTITVDRAVVSVAGVGEWPVEQVSARRVAPGPPVIFVLEVPGGAQLLAAGAGDATERLLAALAAS